MATAYQRDSFVGRPVELRPRAIKRMNLLNARHGASVGIKWPSFDPRFLRPGILHFGCGAFHRAHQNVFTQRAIEMEGEIGSEWGVTGVSFRSSSVRTLLAPQDFLYSVLERGQDETKAEVVGVLKGVLFARDEQARIIAGITNPQTQIITLTVTPSGYSPSQPGRAGQRPSSCDPIGLLVTGLAAIRAQGTRPPVLISCDNIPRNGRQLREAIVQRAGLGSSALARWIEQNVQCPSSVVDRIVPVPAFADCAAASSLLGLQDMATVSTEPFRQWVIEDFEGPRPRWELAGVKFVSDVSPWEASKLNLLNGTHMAIAFLGLLSGAETVADFVLDPVFAQYASRLMLAEQVPTLPESDHDLLAYCGELLERWRNRQMVHRLERIARSGSEKLEPRLLRSLAKNIGAGRPAPCTMLAVAAWICCAGKILPFEGRIEDAAALELESLAARSRGNTEQLVRSLLTREDVLGEELPHSLAFREELIRAIDALKLLGPRRAASKIISAPTGSYV